MIDRDAYEEYDFARFYDWLYQGHEEDLAFYTDIAEEYGSPILEVACGTGRVTIPLARRGFRVVGIDLSEHMLDQARAKLSKETDAVRNLVTFVQADMRDFDLGETFAAVLVPNASVFHLRDKESLSACFSRLYLHTRPGGTAVVDVVAPNRMANQEVGRERVFREGVNPSTGFTTHELGEKLFIDRKSQIVRVRHTYIEDQDGSERRVAFEQDYRWLEEDEGVGLLQSAGFTGVQVLGDHCRSTYNDDSPRLILATTRAAQR